MNATELYKQGQLAEAIQAQIGEVKANPGDQSRRIFLFELLAFSGDLDRARKQIDAVNYGEMERDAAVSGYRRLLDAEQARRSLFAGGVAPRFFSDTVPRHAELRLQAVQALRDQRPDEAARLLHEAQAATPTAVGMLNGKPFAGLRDCDDLFGGILEGMAQGQYFWVPLQDVESIALSPPRFPRDLIWFPARLELRQRGMGEVYLPNLYPGSYLEENTALKLGRLTEFTETDPIRGKGSRLFLAGDDAIPLLEWRELVMAETAGSS